MIKKIVIILAILVAGLVLSGCIDEPTEAKSDSGVTKISVDVQTGSDGLTVEQRNVRDRLLHDNKVGAIEYLYIFSSMSGQIIYSDVVKGKVTSSGKRLTPKTVAIDPGSMGYYGMPVIIGDRQRFTEEVLGDDGTWGDSMSYLFYWDTKDIYHQIYVSGGQMVIITDQPISLNGVTVNIDMEE